MAPATAAILAALAVLLLLSDEPCFRTTRSHVADLPLAFGCSGWLWVVERRMPQSGVEFWFTFAKMVAVASAAGVILSLLWFGKIDPYLEKRWPMWKRWGGHSEGSD